MMFGAITCTRSLSNAFNFFLFHYSHILLSNISFHLTMQNKQASLFSFFGNKGTSVTPTNDGEGNVADIVKPASDTTTTHNGSAEKKVQFTDLPEKKQTVPTVSSEKNTTENIKTDSDACDESMDRLASQSDSIKEDIISPEEPVKEVAGKGKKGAAKRKRGEGKTSEKKTPAKSAKKSSKAKVESSKKEVEVTPAEAKNSISDAIKAMPVSEAKPIMDANSTVDVSDVDVKANDGAADMAEAGTASTSTPDQGGLSAEEEAAAFAAMDEEMDADETKGSAVVTPAASAKKAKRSTSSSKKSKAKTPAPPAELSQQAKDNIDTYTAKISLLVNQLETYSDAHPQLFEDYGTMGAIEHIQTLATAEYHAGRRAQKAQQAARIEKQKKDKENKNVEKEKAKESTSNAATEGAMDVEVVASNKTITPATPSAASDTPTVAPSPTSETAATESEDDMEIVIMKAVDSLVARTVQGKKDPLEEVLFFVGQTLQKSYDDLSCLPALNEANATSLDDVTSKKVCIEDISLANKYRECLLIALRHLLAIDSNGESVAMDMEEGNDTSNTNIQEALLRIAEREVMGLKPGKGVDVLTDVANVSAMYRWNVRRENLSIYFEKGVVANVKEARTIIGRYGTAMKALMRTIEQCHKHPYDEAKITNLLEGHEKAILEIQKTEKKLIEQEEKKRLAALDKAQKDVKKAEMEAKRKEAEAKKKEEKDAKEAEKEAAKLKKQQEKEAKEAEKLKKKEEKEAKEAEKEAAKLEAQRLKEAAEQKKAETLKKQRASFGSFFGASSSATAKKTEKLSLSNEQEGGEVVDLTESPRGEDAAGTVKTSPSKPKANNPTPNKARGVVRATSSPNNSEALSLVLDRKIIRDSTSNSPETYTDDLIAKIDTETSFQRLQLNVAGGTVDGGHRKARRHTTIEVAKATNNGFGQETYTEFETKEVDPYMRTLSFYHDHRPAYYGTWSKKSSLVTGRTPFNKDLKYKDYEYDSELEWESDEGEDIDNSDGEEEEDGNELEYDEMFRHDNDFGSDADSDGEEMAAGVMKLSRDQQTFGVRFISKRTDEVQMVTEASEEGPQVVRCSNVDRDYVNLKNYTTLLFAQPGSVPFLGHKENEAKLIKEHVKSSSKKSKPATEKESKSKNKSKEGEADKEASEPTKPKTQMDESLVPELIKHAYGKLDTRDNLVNEFIAIHETQLFNDVKKKFEKLFTKKSGKMEDGTKHGRQRWVVSAEDIAKYNLTLGAATEDQPDLIFDLAPIPFSPFKPKKEKRVRPEKKEVPREFTSKRLKGDSTGLLKPLGHEWWPTPPSSPEREGEDGNGEEKVASANTTSNPSSSSGDGSKQTSLQGSWEASPSADTSTDVQEMEVVETVPTDSKEEATVAVTSDAGDATAALNETVEAPVDTTSDAA